ncbi:hypothetical protein C3L33_05646, partial [Rhododendron williamsianum]
MASSSSLRVSALLLVMFLVGGSAMVVSAGNFYQDMDITWGTAELRYSTTAAFSLSHSTTPPALASNPIINTSLENSICNSSSSLETLLAPSPPIMYLSSQGSTHDEIDMEFLGNLSVQEWESNGVPYPQYQAMRVYASLWAAEDWATRGGLVKTDWTKAPFTASYKNFRQTLAFGLMEDLPVVPVVPLGVTVIHGYQNSWTTRPKAR